jgi:hypothetical protein
MAVMTVLVLFMAFTACEAFAPRTTSLGSRSTFTAASTSACMTPFVLEEAVTTASSFSPSSLVVSAATLDPTSVLSDVFAGLLGTPAILAIPIVAALGVAGLIAFFIISYANPEVDDD